MDGLSFKKYLQTTRKRFDPIGLGLSFAGLGAVIYSSAVPQQSTSYFDLHSVMIVLVGTLASLLFQFDLTSFATSILYVLRSLLGTPEKKLLSIARELDDAILSGALLSSLRDGSRITGELMSDVIFMHRKGLVFEEIDEFVTSRITDQYLARRIAVDVMKRGSIVAPAFGLFGTVMGLIGVLRTLSDPSQIGSSMSLALMTTAYGAGLSTLVFTPMAGRLEHHNLIYLEIHQQILSKIAILLRREERDLNVSNSEGIQAA